MAVDEARHERAATQVERAGALWRGYGARGHLLDLAVGHEHAHAFGALRALAIEHASVPKQQAGHDGVLTSGRGWAYGVSPTASQARLRLSLLPHLRAF